MSSFPERLSDALSASGLTKAQFAREMGITYQAVTKAISADAKGLTAANMQKAASILGVAPAWLTSGEGPRELLVNPLPPLSEAEAALLALLRALPEDVRVQAMAAARDVASRYATGVSVLLLRTGG